MKYIAFINFFVILLKCSYSTSSSAAQCTKPTKFWYSIKYPYLNVLNNIKLQESESFKCSASASTDCCSTEMMNEMSKVSQIKLKGLSEDKIEHVIMLFSNDSFFLMNMFLNDLERTKNDLNQLFSATYGYNYKVEKNFFFSWFDKLKLYMEGKLHNISQLLDDFFLQMAEKIVKILIPPESGPELTKCQTARLIEAKPYQNTDINLKTKIIRSYPPARLLVNAIAVGRDAFKTLMKKTNPSVSCVENFNTQFHCMLCNGLTIKACPQTCKNILDNCFGSLKSSDLKKLDKTFSKFVKSVIKLAGQLDNPFNFPNVNHKMNVQISVAIMNVQNIYPNIKEQIKVKCQNVGGMSLVRKKRQASEEIMNWQKADLRSPVWEENLNSHMRPNVEKKNVLNTHSGKPNDFLSPMAKSIKTKYLSLEKYFTKIVPDFCSANSEAPESQQCWNGTTTIKPITSIDKENKKKDKVLDVIIKTVINRLHDMNTRMVEYLTNKITDPETLIVDEHTIYKSVQENKPVEKSPKSSNSPLIEGSGDLDKMTINEPIVPPKKVEPEVVKPPDNPFSNSGDSSKDQSNQNANLPTQNSQLPLWEGSGDAERKKPENEDNKSFNQRSSNQSKKKITSSIKSSTTSSIEQITTQSTIKPNQIIDDEDLNPEEPVSKVKQVTTTSTPLLPPEGSGSDPDLTQPKPKKPIIETAISTKKPKLPEKLPVEGSGLDVDPKPETNTPRPALPMLPELPEISTQSPSTPKNSYNPDEETSPIEGSGKSNVNQPIPSRPQTITESTLIPTKSSAPDQYPGVIPSEVWIPGLDGVGNSGGDNQRSTPGSHTPPIIHKSSIISPITTLSLLLIYCLL